MKERNEFFYTQLYNGKWEQAGYRWWGAALWKCAFGGRVGANLPMNIKPIFKTIISDSGARVQLKLLPRYPRGVRKNRVTVYCDKCGTWVFAGRVAQHRC